MQSHENRQADVVIVGGGVAGLSCAIFTAKAGLRTIILDSPDSQLRGVKQVWNFPGFEQGIAGADWLASARTQAVLQGAVVREEKVVALELQARPYTAKTETGNTYEAPFLVLAVNLGSELLATQGLELAVNEYVPSKKIRYVTEAQSNGQTSREGVFVAGLLANLPSQSVIAAGQGAFVGVQIASAFGQKPFMWHD
ncbi:MAG: FAD-dependent oxidoreductase [Firmicutes bacterium]|nr:FAD-dependent oxidoreductase [Bacillota bacterium]